MRQRRNTYTVAYRMYGADGERTVDVIASKKEEAYERAVYQAIPAVEGGLPYSAWVESVTYQNGNVREFHTFEGNPY